MLGDVDDGYPLTNQRLSRRALPRTDSRSSFRGDAGSGTLFRASTPTLLRRQPSSPASVTRSDEYSSALALQKLSERETNLLRRQMKDLSEERVRLESRISNLVKENDDLRATQEEWKELAEDLQLQVQIKQQELKARDEDLACLERELDASRIDAEASKAEAQARYIKQRKKRLELLQKYRDLKASAGEPQSPRTDLSGTDGGFGTSHAHVRQLEQYKKLLSKIAAKLNCSAAVDPHDGSASHLDSLYAANMNILTSIYSAVRQGGDLSSSHGRRVSSVPPLSRIAHPKRGCSDEDSTRVANLREELQFERQQGATMRARLLQWKEKDDKQATIRRCINIWVAWLLLRQRDRQRNYLATIQLRRTQNSTRRRTWHLWIQVTGRHGGMSSAVRQQLLELENKSTSMLESLALSLPSESDVAALTERSTLLEQQIKDKSAQLELVQRLQREEKEKMESLESELSGTKLKLKRFETSVSDSESLMAERADKFEQEKQSMEERLLALSRELEAVRHSAEMAREQEERHKVESRRIRDQNTQLEAAVGNITTQKTALDNRLKTYSETVQHLETQLSSERHNVEQVQQDLQRGIDTRSRLEEEVHTLQVQLAAAEKATKKAKSRLEADLAQERERSRKLAAEARMLQTSVDDACEAEEASRRDFQRVSREAADLQDRITELAAAEAAAKSLKRQLAEGVEAKERLVRDIAREQEKARRLAAELDDAEEDKRRLRATFEAERDTATQELSAVHEQCERLKRQLSQSTGNQDTYEKKIASLEEGQRRLESVIAEERDNNEALRQHSQLELQKQKQELQQTAGLEEVNDLKQKLAACQEECQAAVKVSAERDEAAIDRAALEAAADQLRADLQRITAEQEASKAQLSQAQERCDSLESELDASKEGKEEIRTLQDENDALRDETKQLQSAVEEMSKKCQKLTADLERSNHEVTARFENEVSQLKKQLEEQEAGKREVQEHAADVNRLEKECREQKEECDRLSSQLAEFETQNLNLKEQLAVHEAGSDEVAVLREKLAEAEAKCNEQAVVLSETPLLRSAVADAEERCDKLLEELAVAKRQYREVSAQQSAEEAGRAEQEELVSQLREEAVLLQQQASSAKELTDALSTELECSKQEYADLRNQLSNTAPTSELRVLQDNLESRSRQCEALAQQLTQTQNTCSSLESQVYEYEERSQRLAADLGSAKGQLAEMREQLATQGLRCSAAEEELSTVRQELQALEECERKAQESERLLVESTERLEALTEELNAEYRLRETLEEQLGSAGQNGTVDSNADDSTVLALAEEKLQLTQSLSSISAQYALRLNQLQKVITMRNTHGS